MKKTVLILVLWLPYVIFAQGQKPYRAHQNLLGDEWQIETHWKDGSPFKLSISYEQGLDGNLLRTRTMGNIGIESYHFGLRNEGIIFYDKSEENTKFYEFDVFGNVTTGKVVYEGNTIYYNYTYDHDGQIHQLTDAWEYVDRDTYNFVIGHREEGVWKEKLLEGIMIRKQN